MKFSLSYLLVLVFILVSININAAPSILGNRKAKTLSDRKLLQIEKIVQRAFKQNKDAKYEDIKSAIIGEVGAVFPVNDNNKLLKVNYGQIEKDAAEEANQKYPLTEEQLEQKYKEDADKKFFPAELNTEVEVKYKLGRNKVVKVKGIYRGLNRFHNGLLVGSNTVPVFDLLPEDKARFIEHYRNLRKKSYILENTKDYLANRGEYRLKLIQKKIETINRENEKNGYIFAWRVWRTPVDTAEMIYKYHLVQVLKDKSESSKPQSSKSQSTKKNNQPKSQDSKETQKMQSGLKTLMTKYHGTVNQILNETKQN